MRLETKDGMILIRQQDLESLHQLKHLVTNFRDTIAFLKRSQKENKPIDNLLSKLWRLAEEIETVIKTLGQ